MSTYDDKLGLAKPATDGSDTSWGVEINENWDAIGDLMSPDRTYFVSPAFASGGIPTLANSTSRRHFDTIQGALNAAKAAWPTAPGAVILVYPGTYQEKLVIDRHSVAIVGLGGHGFFGAGVVTINGSGNAEEVIRITPPNAQLCRVKLLNLAIENRYNTSNGTEITTAYAIVCDDIGGGESDGSAQNVLSVENCSFRMQTWGLNNKWKYGVRAVGWWDVHFRTSQIQGLKNAGGANVGYIRNLLSVEGSVARSKTISLRCFETNFDTDTTATGAPTLFTVEYGNNAALLFHRSTANQTAVASKSLIGAGTNTHRGFDSGELASVHFNAFGLAVMAM